MGEWKEEWGRVKQMVMHNILSCPAWFIHIHPTGTDGCGPITEGSVLFKKEIGREQQERECVRTGVSYKYASAYPQRSLARILRLTTGK